MNNQCFNCGADVDSEDYERVGSQKVYCCDELDCQKELRHELRDYEAQIEEEARSDNYARYRR